MKLTKKMCEQMFTQYDLNTQQWVMSVLAELQDAKEQHPNWPTSPELEYKDVALLKDKHVADFVNAAAIVAEESGELIRAALQFHSENGRYFDMHKEAIQTAAMALRFLVEAPPIKLSE